MTWIQLYMQQDILAFLSFGDREIIIIFAVLKFVLETKLP